jgi:hypothetical protein
VIELACSTHALLVDSVLFAGPVVVCALALWIAARRDRGREDLRQDQVNVTELV